VERTLAQTAPAPEIDFVAGAIVKNHDFVAGAIVKKSVVKSGSRLGLQKNSVENFVSDDDDDEIPELETIRATAEISDLPENTEISEPKKTISADLIAAAQEAAENESGDSDSVPGLDDDSESDSDSDSDSDSEKSEAQREKYSKAQSEKCSEKRNEKRSRDDVRERVSHSH
jgi:hypothetical protein